MSVTQSICSFLHSWCSPGSGDSSWVLGLTLSQSSCSTTVALALASLLGLKFFLVLNGTVALFFVLRYLTRSRISLRTTPELKILCLEPKLLAASQASFLTSVPPCFRDRSQCPVCSSASLSLGKSSFYCLTVFLLC